MTSTNVGDAGVSYLHWSADEKQFYYGTRGGEVHLVSLTLFMVRSCLTYFPVLIGRAGGRPPRVRGMWLIGVLFVCFSFQGRTLLNLSVHPILFLDSPIVQISDFESLLLVSNYTKCILCNTEYEEYKQVSLLD